MTIRPGHAPTITAEDFRHGMQRLAAGVTIVATGTARERSGFTATAVMSLSDDPPSLVVGVGRGNRTHEPLLQSGHFSVNVLGSGQHRVADAFCGRLGLVGAQRFAVGDWDDSGAGCPVLKAALVVFECRLADTIATPTHTVVVGHVTGITTTPGTQPLVYWQRDYNDVQALVPPCATQP